MGERERKRKEEGDGEALCHGSKDEGSSEMNRQNHESRRSGAGTRKKNKSTEERRDTSKLLSIDDNYPLSSCRYPSLHAFTHTCTTQFSKANIPLKSREVCKQPPHPPTRAKTRSDQIGEEIHPSILHPPDLSSSVHFPLSIPQFCILSSIHATRPP